MLTQKQIFAGLLSALALAACSQGAPPASETSAAAPAATTEATASDAPAPEAPAVAEAPAAPAETPAVDPAAAASAEPAATTTPTTEAGPAPTTAAAGAIPLEISFNGQAMTGDPEAGRAVFRQCQACHVLEAGVNRVGPSLAGLIGRTAGTVEGFRYSAANKGSGIIWTEQALFDYLENPRAKIPGTIMAFAGLRKPEDRANVVAYIKSSGQ